MRERPETLTEMLEEEYWENNETFIEKFSNSLMKEEIFQEKLHEHRLEVEYWEKLGVTIS